ncbi:MAG: DUF507 family protein [Oligoflexia bacterium]|nr:DUF507 family protein [Bdellovibrionales bacterium]MYE07263.1 DUF507 family protein [Oligoflexia bacterium]
MLHWKQSFSQYLSKLIFKEWKTGDLVEWQTGEEEITEHIHHILSTDLNKERELESEVNLMLDELSKTHTGQFERYKMYPLLKKELAKKKGVIL